MGLRSCLGIMVWRNCWLRMRDVKLRVSPLEREPMFFFPLMSWDHGVAQLLVADA